MLAGKYRIEGLLGKGGMGVVYAAHHELLNQKVAIKLLSNERADDPAAAVRFLNEARAAARIPSDHVVRVLDVGVAEDGRPYLVMEHLSGFDLGRMLEQRKRLPVGEAVSYVLEAIEALAQAHALGIVHRDLKPSNLFLAERGDGVRTIKVLDFGIAKAFGAAAGAHAAVTTQGLVGSPAYMPPEYVRSSKNVGPATDIWAIGVILYELLTGRLPFDGENVGAILAAILESQPPPLAMLRADVPPRLAAVIETCLRKKPDERFTDLADLADALAPFAAPPSPSVARIRTTTATLRARPSLPKPAPPPRAMDGDAPTMAAPSVQTNDSWTGGRRSTAQHPSVPRRVIWGLAALSVLSITAITAVLFAVRTDAPSASASASATTTTTTTATATATETATETETETETATATATAPAPAPAPARAPAPASAPAAASALAMESARPPSPAPRPRPPVKPAPAPVPTLTRDRL